MGELYEEILYTGGHKCVPNGAGDYKFICPEKGERLGFIPFMGRRAIRGVCECGQRVELEPGALLCFELVSENLSGLGGPMGTEEVTINWRKHFSSLRQAMIYAEEDYGQAIPRWIDDGPAAGDGRNVRSPDFGYVMYRIKTVTVGDK